MSSGEDREIEDIANRLHRLQLERFRIYEEEKELLSELVEIRRRRDTTRQVSTGAEQETRERVTGSNRAPKERSDNKKRDRFGNELKVGDRVEFLTSGRLVGKIWTIYKITEKRVLCERHNGVHKTHREFKNVRKVD